MTSVNRKLVTEGDWVSGTSFADEKLIGYVESIDLNGLVKVRVTQSDNDGAIGRTVETKLSKIERLPEYVPSDPADIRSLMELALMTWDRAWFEELGAGRTGTADASSGVPKSGSSGEYKAPHSGGKRVNID